MKKLLCIALLLGIAVSMPILTIHGEEENKNTYPHYIIDNETNTVLSKYKENERRPIASMVKIMSLNIIFDEILKGNLTLDSDIVVSKYAASQGGSELLIDSGATYKTRDLIKGIIVVSANDATVAMAEHIANNEDNFVKLMNEKAVEMGLHDTLFVNATGLPKDNQYSTAHDVTIMMQNLLKYPQYFDFANIWTENYTHPSGRITNLTNTNKLIRYYDGCDGGKTGFTNDAGFCLSCTVKRNEMRLVGTIMGADNSKRRFKTITDAFNDIFRDYSYKVLKRKDEIIDNDIVIKGARGKKVELLLEEDVKALMGKDIKENYSIDYVLPSSINAPVKRGDKVGYCILSRGATEIKRVNIIANNDIKRNTIFDDLKELNTR